MHTEGADPVADKIIVRATELFERAVELQLDLSEDDSAYDLLYIGQKLTQCTCIQEKLAVIQMQLTRISLTVLRVESKEWDVAKKTLREIKEAVANQVQTVRRLDSDIRLQHKLLEAKVSAGADSHGFFPGPEKKEVAL